MQLCILQKIYLYSLVVICEVSVRGQVLQDSEGHLLKRKCLVLTIGLGKELESNKYW